MNPLSGFENASNEAARSPGGFRVVFDQLPAQGGLQSFVQHEGIRFKLTNGVPRNLNGSPRDRCPDSFEDTRHSRKSPECPYAVRRSSGCTSSSSTDTSFETPFSSMVTP